VVVEGWTTAAESRGDGVSHAMANDWVALPTVERIKGLFKVLGTTSQPLFNPAPVSSSHLALDGWPE
jgi:hypothetical protein